MIVNMVAPWERNTVTCLEYTRMQQLYSYLLDKPGTVTFATRPKTGEMTPLVSAWPTGPWQLPKSWSLDNSVSPTNLRWPVDEADGRAHDDPLNGVGDGLVDCQRKADVHVDVVVDREGADREKADERTEIYAGYDAATSSIDFCVENRDDHDGDEDGDHPVGH